MMSCYVKPFKNMGGGVDNPWDHTFYLFDCSILCTKRSVEKQCEKATMLYCNYINIYVYLLKLEIGGHSTHFLEHYAIMPNTLSPC